MSESTPKHGYAPSQQISHRKRSVESWLDSTCAVHAGTHDDPGTGAAGTPIYQTSTFNLGAKQYAAVAGGTARDGLFARSEELRPTATAIILMRKASPSFPIRGVLPNRPNGRLG